MRFYKTGKSIIKASLEDIQNGQWCKGKLAELGTCAVAVDAKSVPYTAEIDEDFAGRHRLWTSKSKLEDVQKKDPMGCAMGLIAMHAGIGKEIVVRDRKTKEDIVFFVPRYANFKDGPGVKAAMLALYNAIPATWRKTRERYEGERADPTNSDHVMGYIIGYNDDECDQAKAKRWFKKALDSFS